MEENISSVGYQSKLSIIAVASFDLSVLTWGQQWQSLSGKTPPTSYLPSHSMGQSVKVSQW